MFSLDLLVKLVADVLHPVDIADLVSGHGHRLPLLLPLDLGGVEGLLLLEIGDSASLVRNDPVKVIP